jgi:hypothetical protein
MALCLAGSSALPLYAMWSALTPHPGGGPVKVEFDEVDWRGGPRGGAARRGGGGKWGKVGENLGRASSA